MHAPQTQSVKLIHLGQVPVPQGWYVSHWDAGQSSILAWSLDNVRNASNDSLELVLSAAPQGSDRPFLGGEVQSIESARTGIWSWTAQAPELVSGSVFGMFAYRADHFTDPWIEFDIDFLGRDGGDFARDGDVDLFQARLNIRMETDTGEHVSLEQANDWRPVVVNLGFDATEGLHTYAIIVTETEAIFLVDGGVVGRFDSRDVPDGTWRNGEMKGFDNLWSAHPTPESWAGEWVYPGEPLVATISAMEVCPDYVGGF